MVPQTDIVLEAANAADPRDLRVALERLSAIARTRHYDEIFGNMLSEGLPAGTGASSAAGLPTPFMGAQEASLYLQRMRASSGHQSAGELEGAVSPEQKSLRQLEAYFLQTVLSEIMPQQKSGLLGDGYADDMWRQMSCEHMANQLAKRDVLGFEKTMLARVDEDFHNAREHGSKD